MPTTAETPEPQSGRLWPHGGVAHSDGIAAVSQARHLTQRIGALRQAGLAAKAAFLILQAYGQSCVNHLQRANYEDGRWVGDLEDSLFEGLDNSGSDSDGDDDVVE